jgi:hypothetical protein
VHHADELEWPWASPALSNSTSALVDREALARLLVQVDDFLAGRVRISISAGNERGGRPVIARATSTSSGAGSPSQVTLLRVLALDEIAPPVVRWGS